MTYQEAATQAFGEAVSFEAQILRSYDHDLGEMPRALMAMIQHRPHTVVVARSAADVAAALHLAERYDVPVTPRGQASAGYGGAIPCRGGMVLDLSNCNRILAVDADNSTVDVEPGVVWEDLSRALAPHGLDNRVCPTSAPSSTVGGWFAMGGVGIGSLRYGSIRDSVLEIDVAGLDGIIHTYSGADMEPFHQTCGGLGVVTRLRLACRPAEAILPLAVRLPDATATARFLTAVQTDPAVYSASLANAGYCALRAQAEGHPPVLDSGFLVSLALVASQADTAAIARLVADCGGDLLDDAVATQEWKGRFYPMRIKKIGPSALVGEFFIPFEGFAATAADLTAALPGDAFGLEAFAVRGGKLAVLVYILDDAKSLLYPLRMAKAMIPLRLAARHGGAPYAAGMWFSALASTLYGREKLAQVKRLKTRQDTRDLLNPGTVGGLWLPFLPFISLSRCILWATSCLAPLAARLSSPRRSATNHPGAAS